MKDYYPEKVVYYNAYNKDYRRSVDVKYFENNLTNELRNQVKDAYPFSEFATDAMIHLLFNTNRINMIDQNIWDINSGL
jgi:hypothetical protein